MLANRGRGRTDRGQSFWHRRWAKSLRTRAVVVVMGISKCLIRGPLTPNDLGQSLLRRKREEKKTALVFRYTVESRWCYSGTFRIVNKEVPESQANQSRGFWTPFTSNRSKHALHQSDCLSSSTPPAIWLRLYLNELSRPAYSTALVLLFFILLYVREGGFTRYESSRNPTHAEPKLVWIALWRSQYKTPTPSLTHQRGLFTASPTVL